MSAAYIHMCIQVHLILDFIMEAFKMIPDQTAPLGAVWSGFILFAANIAYLRSWADERADNISNNWYEELVLAYMCYVMLCFQKAVNITITCNINHDLFVRFDSLRPINNLSFI